MSELEEHFATWLLEQGHTVPAAGWISPAACAALLGIRVRTLRDWHGRGFGPPAIELGPRTRVYRLADVALWVQKQEQERRRTTLATANDG